MIKVRSIHVYNDEKIYYFIQDEEKACFYSDDEAESVINPSMNREEMEKAVGDFLNQKGVKIKDNCSINNLYPPLAYIYSTMVLSEYPEKGIVVNDQFLKEATAKIGWSKKEILIRIKKDVKQYHLEEDVKFDFPRMHFATEMNSNDECFLPLQEALAINDKQRPSYYAIFYPSLLEKFTIEVEKEKGFFGKLFQLFFK